MRSRELSTAKEILEGAQERPRLVVTGVSGVGKGTFVEALLQGRPALRTRLEPAKPFSPAVHLESLLRAQELASTANPGKRLRAHLREVSSAPHLVVEGIDSEAGVVVAQGLAEELADLPTILCGEAPSLAALSDFEILKLEPLRVQDAADFLGSLGITGLEELAPLVGGLPLTWKLLGFLAASTSVVTVEGALKNQEEPLDALLELAWETFTDRLAPVVAEAFQQDLGEVEPGEGRMFRHVLAALSLATRDGLGTALAVHAADLGGSLFDGVIDAGTKLGLVALRGERYRIHPAIAARILAREESSDEGGILGMVRWFNRMKAEDPQEDQAKRFAAFSEERRAFAALMASFEGVRLRGLLLSSRFYAPRSGFPHLWLEAVARCDTTDWDADEVARLAALRSDLQESFAAE